MLESTMNFLLGWVFEIIVESRDFVPENFLNLIAAVTNKKYNDDGSRLMNCWFVFFFGWNKKNEFFYRSDEIDYKTRKYDIR